MEEETIYVSIWAILILFTVLEVASLILGFSYLLIALLIVVLAGGKALLIASFYQHLKYETSYLVAIPLFALAMLIALVTISIAGVI